jgi:hypothetical protein
MSRRKSWITRSIQQEASARRQQMQAEALQAERNRRVAERVQAREDAEQEVAAYESDRDYLLSLHTECGPAWNWEQVAGQLPPRPPAPSHKGEAEAKGAVDAYEPSFVDKIFFQAGKKRSTLEHRLTRARDEETAANAKAQTEYEQQIERHKWETRIAAGILRGESESYREAIEGIAPFAELSEAGTTVNVLAIQKDVITLQCVVDRKVLPEEEKKLTASGKLTVKTLAQTAKWTMHETFVSSCALRVAREAFAVLPIARAVINVSESGVDTSTGQDSLLTLLAASVDRAVLEGFRFETIEPIASLKNLPNRINFKKSSGFEPVEPMTDQESFMTMKHGRA